MEKNEPTPVFSKEQLMSVRRGVDRDILSALLEDGKTYTKKQADTLVNKFKKGKVN